MRSWLYLFQVTLIENLEQFGIDPSVFAHEVQIGVAGSTAINPLPGKKHGEVQVLVQGNQIVFIAQLLMGEYATRPSCLCWCFLYCWCFVDFDVDVSIGVDDDVYTDVDRVVYNKSGDLGV